jgi:hypothetical protein
VHRRVFLTFDYGVDAARADQVRRSQESLEPGNEFVGSVDAASWKEIERQGDDAIKRWILSNLDGTSVTAVIYGGKTWTHRWVRYAIVESVRRGNGLVAIDLLALKDPQPGASEIGVNPLSQLGFVIDRTLELVHFYENHGEQWMRPRDSDEAMKLADFRYSFTRDEARFTAIAVNERFSEPSAASNLPLWIERATKLAGR